MVCSIGSYRLCLNLLHVEKSDFYFMVMQVMKLLGEGGSGQTWLCRSSKTSKLVAIKFIQRPIPKIVLPMLMYEIKVSHQITACAAHTSTGM